MASTPSFQKLDAASELSDAHTTVLEDKMTAISEFQLKPERTRQVNTVMIGHWDDTSNMAIVEVAKGTHLNTMGVRGRVDMLYPEEMMFLVNKSRMCLFLTDNPQPASIEECMSLVLISGVTLPEFLVYSHLKSLGCVVFRHGTIITSLQPSSGTRPQYDVWLPQGGQEKAWSRKNVPPPSFHLVISADTSFCNEFRLDEHISMTKQLVDLTSDSKVPIRLATVSSGGLIEFFECSAGSVPIDS